MNDDRRRGSGCRLSSKLCRAQSPATQSSRHQARARRRGSAGPGRRRSASASAWWAPGASIGLPIVTMPGTRSGRRTASPRASMPPRLWPTICTRRPRRSDDRLEPASSWAAASSVQPTLAWMCGAVGAVARAAQARAISAQRAVAGEEAGHQHAPARRRAARAPAYGVSPAARRSAAARTASRPASVRRCPRGARPRARGGRSRRAAGTAPAGVPRSRRYGHGRRSQGPRPHGRVVVACRPVRVVDWTPWHPDARARRRASPRSCSPRSPPASSSATRPSATPDGEPLLLVMGLGGPMTWWDPDLCRAAGRARLLRHPLRQPRHRPLLPGPRPGDPRRRWSGRSPARRVRRAVHPGATWPTTRFGLLDHLGLDAAHVVGVSMGGMIAQTMAIDRAAAGSGR